MPNNKGFVSQAQMRKFALMVKQGRISKATFKRWLDETPSITKLPERKKIKKKRNKSRNNNKKERNKKNVRPKSFRRNRKIARAGHKRVS